MAIKRAKRRTNFTMISNVGLRDERLSYKAKGLLAYMLSLPDDWIFYESELVKHSVDGKASVKSGLKELQDAGYLTRQRKRNDKGQLKETLWEISDEPMSDYPTLGKPTLGKPTLDNQPLLNTNLTKDLPKQKTNKTKDQKNAPKRKYGEFDNVLLTDEEHEKLKERFPYDLDKRIERLSGYVASTGKKYKSHYATIINWAKKDNKGTKERSSAGGSEYDIF